MSDDPELVALELAASVARARRTEELTIDREVANLDLQVLGLALDETVLSARRIVLESQDEERAQFLKEWTTREQAKKAITDNDWLLRETKAEVLIQESRRQYETERPAVESAIEARLEQIARDKGITTAEARALVLRQ